MRANVAERRTQVGGGFDPEACSAAEAMKAMRKGLPNWRDSR
jgi:hypothetical protein